MVLQWDPWAIPGLASLALGLAMAAFVLAARPQRAQNRWLALSMALTSLLGASVSLRLLVEPRLRWYANVELLGPVLLLLPLAYLSFLATLPAPLARPLRWRPFRLALAGATLAGLALWFLRPETFVAEVHVQDLAPHAVILRPHAWVAPTLMLGAALAFASGVPIAWSAWRAARAEAARRQALTFLLAFGIRDLLFVAWILTDLLRRGNERAMTDAQFGFVSAAADAVFVGALAYGILRAQLFDFDRRAQAALARLLWLGIGGVLLFAAFQLAEALVADALGPVFGLLALFALHLAQRPVEALTQRLARAFVPVRDEDERARKLDVYRVALESARESGDVDARERAMLDRLRAKLGLAPEDVAPLDAGDARPDHATPEAAPG